MVAVDNCCCCLSLKTGTIIIGTLGILSSIVSILDNFVSFTYNRNPDNTTVPLDQDDLQRIDIVNLSISILMFLNMLVEFILSILLVYGAVKERSRFIYPWIVYTSICICVAFVMLLSLSVMWFIYGNVGQAVAFLMSCIIASHTMPMLVVDNCCCCVSLRTGSIIIGQLCILSSFAGIVDDIVTLAFRERSPDNRTVEIVDQDGEMIMDKVYSVVAVIMFVDMLLEFILSILLVYGAVKEIPRFVRPWIIYTIICISVAVVLLLTVGVVGLLYVDMTEAVIILICTILSLFIVIYFVIVVNSYHRRLIGVDLPQVAVKLELTTNS